MNNGSIGKSGHSINDHRETEARRWALDNRKTREKITNEFSPVAVL
jgi:hypothetical protein